MIYSTEPAIAPDNSTQYRSSTVDFDLDIRLNACGDERQASEKDTSPRPLSDCISSQDKLRDCVSYSCPNSFARISKTLWISCWTKYSIGCLVAGFQLTQADSVNKLIDAGLDPIVVPKIVACEPFNRRVEAKVVECAEAQFSKFGRF
jgi:hypothetical protein